MTHGDKAKAKAGKSSQASAAKKSSSTKEAVGKGAEGKGGGKVAPQSGRESGEPSKISIKKAGAEKGGAAAPGPEKSASSGKEGGAGKTRGRPADDNGTFSNPVVGTAFKRAIQKYPNAFRKLTD